MAAALDDDSSTPPEWDAELGTAARLLHQRGHRDAVLLLMEVQTVTTQWTNSWSNMDSYDYCLGVPIAVLDDLTEEVEEQIRSAMELVLRPKDECVSGIILAPITEHSDWRAELKGALNGKPTNQATRAPLPPLYPTMDNMRFRDPGEVAVYEALKRAQANMPNHDTLMIVPNPSVRVSGHTWEPDFLVTYGGKAGVIEVDGATHSRRWAADKTKDAVYEDAGVAYITRIPVEDTANPDELDDHVSRFLSRLLS